MAIQFSDMTFDHARWQLHRGSEPVHVSPGAFPMAGHPDWQETVRGLEGGGAEVLEGPAVAISRPWVAAGAALLVVSSRPRTLKGNSSYSNCSVEWDNHDFRGG
jgi:hypothetical protein